MTKTFTKESLVILDNEVYVVSKNTETSTATIEHEGCKYGILATTDNSVLNVPELDRSVFVRPVDVDNMAKIAIPDGYNKFTSIAIREAWKAGYNANKGVYTEEQMKEAMALAFVHGQQNVISKELAIKSYLDIVNPLSLPQKIELDEQYNATKIEW